MGKRTSSKSASQSKTAAKKNDAKIGIMQRGDTPILEIQTPFYESQILVSLRKVPAGGGASAWLSPVGWSDIKKSTLLDCYENDAGCEIIIPDTYAKDIEAGDKIHVSCAALNVRGDAVWRAPAAAPTPAPIKETAAAPTGLMARLLSRGTSETPAPAVPAGPESDAKRRTAEAQKLSDEYRVQMEKAASAREVAQRQALEAARRAEDALQAEADRIAEMESAAKAYAEAEAQRQDEERRLDAERRAEELRLAEEARIAEEARQRELAIARAAERAEEKARLVSLQEDASSRRAALTERMEAARSSLHRLGVDRSAKADALADLTAGLADKETDLSILAQDLNAQKGGLGALDERLVIANARNADARMERDQMKGSAMAAARALELAEAEVKAAMDRAKICKNEHDNLSGQLAELTQRADKSARGLAALHNERTEAEAAADKAQGAYDAAQAGADAHRAKMDALIHDDADMEAKQTAHNAELERLARDLDAALSRQDAAKAALQTLDEGGDVRAARQIMASVDDAPIITEVVAEPAVKAAAKPSPVSTLFGKTKAAALVVPAKVLVQADDAPAELAAPQDETPSETPLGIIAAQAASNAAASPRNHKFMAMGAGALALSIALGFGVSSMTRPDVEKSVSVKPAPTQVLATEIKAADIAITPKAADVKIETPVKVTEAIIPEVKAPEVTVPEAKAPIAKVAELKLEPKYKAVNVSRMARRAATADNAERIKAARAEAARIRREKAAAQKEAAAKTEPTLAPANPAPKAAPKIALKTKPVKVAAIVRDMPAAAAPAVPAVRFSPEPTPETRPSPLMSLAVTRDVQENLARLGYYTGPNDGVMRPELREAASLFNTIYDRPAGDRFTADFVTRLSNVVTDLNAVQAARPVQVASIAAPVAPVTTSPLSAAPLASAPAVTEPAVQEAAVTAPAPVAVPDQIVEPKALQSLKLEYPSKAMRRNVYENVTVVVTYDIGVDGSVANARVNDIDYTGRFASAFEEEALSGVRAMRFAPKTVNGEAVSAPGQSKRVRFRVE